MYQIIWLVVVVLCFVLMSKAKSKVVNGQPSSDPLNSKDKVTIWILCLLNPVVSGVIFYYGWKKTLPVKAKQANKISLWAFLIELVVGILLFVISAQS